MKILVISSNLIGDTVLSTCIIEHFSKIYSNAKFTFLIGPSAGQIYQNHPAKENIILIKKKRFNFHWLDMYLSVRKTKWEIIIDLRSSLISYFLNNKKKFIFKKNKLFSHLEQLKEVFKLENPSLFIHTSIEENIEAEKKLKKKYKYVVIFPGGNWKPKIWPSEYYNKLIIILINRYANIKFVIVGSSKEKNIYLDKVIANLPENIFVNLMGKSLTLTSAYMKKCKLFIGNDSGLMHLSVASNLTTIALFGPTNDKIYGHHNSNSYVIRTKENFDFFNKRSIDLKKSYMLSIQPDEILNLINKNKLL